MGELPDDLESKLGYRIGTVFGHIAGTEAARHAVR